MIVPKLVGRTFGNRKYKIATSDADCFVILTQDDLRVAGSIRATAMHLLNQ